MSSRDLQSDDMTKEALKLNAAEQHFVKKLEQLNVDRANNMKVLRGRNKLFGIAIGAGVLGICIL
jgi:hypothetical protein